MRGLRIFLARVRALFGERKAGAELDEELETHLALLTERYARQGMRLEGAAVAARRQFGNRTEEGRSNPHRKTLRSSGAHSTFGCARDFR
jgi:hypothetical protein